MSEIAKMIKVNAETLPNLVDMHNGAIHGDFTLNGRQAWDIEFPDMRSAVVFAEIHESNDVYSADLRDAGDLETVPSLWSPVVVTLILNGENDD